jgi:membrane fusion protein, macrolide-specific efflux system
MSERAGAPWLLYILATLCVAAAVAAFLVVGPPAQSASPTRTATVGRGVVLSTVSASGTLEAAAQASVNFKTSGELAAVYVHTGEHVLAGRLLAELNPVQAQRSLTVAEDDLRAARDRLTDAREGGSTESSNSSSSTGKGEGAAPASNQAPSPATKAANIAGDEAAVESANAAVTSAEEALANTKLYAPVDGTVASIATETPGDSVSAGANTSGSNSTGSSDGNSGASGSGAAAGGASSGSGSSGNSASAASSSSGSSGSSGFITLVNTSSMQVVVPLSESDITKVKVDQPASITVNALPTEKLSAKVISSALLSTSNSGVVSYDVTLKLEQGEHGLRPGMSASAQIVVARAEDAINVTSAAISGRGATQTVTVLRSGKAIRQPVMSGLVGDTVTQILSGLTPGEQVQVPIATGASLGAGSAIGALAGRAGGLGTGGGLAGGGGARFFGGGGAAR